MNSDQRLGRARFLLGCGQEFLGSILGSERQRRKGFENKIAGEARKAIGDAQRLIETCRHAARSSSPSPDQACLPGAAVLKKT
jgi:uncharacterized protein YjbJ (UPF0337 family)